jgi:hypothetical protein
VLARNFPTRRVDDEVDVAILDAVQDVWASFVNFEDLGDLDFRFCKGNPQCRLLEMISKPSFTNSRAT